MIGRISGIVLCSLLITYPSLATDSKPFVEPVTGMEFVPIKGGCFDMGDSIGDGDPNERPVHKVCIGDVHIAKFETTNAQYRKFKPNHRSGSSENLSLDDDDQPVVNVTWEDAIAFAQWLSKKGNGTYQLPSEAEWEFAARGGNLNGRFWGNSLDDACKYANVADLSAKKLRPAWTVFPCDDGSVVSAPVGRYLANGFGLHDVLGNVWEWCFDTYNSEAYQKLPKDNPLFLGAGEYRVMRGGGWSNGPLGIRSSHRVGLSPDFGHHSLGFRLVKK